MGPPNRRLLPGTRMRATALEPSVELPRAAGEDGPATGATAGMGAAGGPVADGGCGGGATPIGRQTSQPHFPLGLKKTESLLYPALTVMG